MGDSLVSEVKDVLNKILDYLYDKENLQEEDEVLLDFIYTFGALEEGQKLNRCYIKRPWKTIVKMGRL